MESLTPNWWDNIVPHIMQKEVKCSEMDSKKISERFCNMSYFMFKSIR